MQELINKIDSVRKSDKKEIIDNRMKELELLGKNSDTIFSELCFCLMTANFNAERSISIQKEIGEGFCSLPEPELANKLKELGHRFPNTRASYIANARKHLDSIKDTIEEFKNEKELREWIVKNVKGLGYKEASHFMRNIGFKNVAIVDFHIVDILAKHNMIEKPKTLTKRKYIEIESILSNLAKKVNMNLAELDFYLWYIETGKILK